MLLAITNQDIKMFELLWTTLGSYLWTLSHFECVVKQLLHLKWVEGVHFLFQSQVTKQIILSLQSDERSNFIENFVGDPFAKELKSEIKRSLVFSLCNPPYGGSLLIFMLDNFEDLTTVAPLKKTEQSLVQKL